MAALGELVEVVRLPTGAHNAMAGTKALTDILVFRRHADQQAAAGYVESHPDWLECGRGARTTAGRAPGQPSPGGRRRRPVRARHAGGADRHVRDRGLEVDGERDPARLAARIRELFELPPLPTANADRPAPPGERAGADDRCCPTFRPSRRAELEHSGRSLGRASDHRRPASCTRCATGDAHVVAVPSHDAEGASAAAGDARHDPAPARPGVTDPARVRGRGDDRPAHPASERLGGVRRPVRAGQPLHAAAHRTDR